MKFADALLLTDKPDGSTPWSTNDKKKKYVEAHLRPCNVHPNPTQPQKDFEYFDTYIQKIWQRKWECLNISFSEQQIWSTFKFMQTYIYDIFININHATIGPQWVGWDRVCTCGYLCRHCSKDCSKGSKSLFITWSMQLKAIHASCNKQTNKQTNETIKK